MGKDRETLSDAEVAAYLDEVAPVIDGLVAEKSAWEQGNNDHMNNWIRGRLAPDENTDGPADLEEH